MAHALDALKASKLERITLLGRRGPHQIMMTPKELGELLHLERARPSVDAADLPPGGDDAVLEPGLRKSVTLLRDFAAQAEDPDKAITIDFAFFTSPAALLGDDGHVRAVRVERTVVEKGRAVGTGEFDELPADLVVSCIGYRTSPIEGVPFDERAGRFANDGLYCVGWARRGPSGTIGTNRPDGYAIVDRIAEDIGQGSRKQGREGFDALAEKRGIDIVTFRDWQRIEEAEIAAARDGSPREKFIDVASMIAASGPRSSDEG